VVVSSKKAASDPVREYLASIGRAGGVAGRGESKRRPSSHYAKLGEIHKARYSRLKADQDSKLAK